MSRPSTVTRRTRAAILRADVDAGRVDFSRVASGRRLPPSHPGKLLRREFLEPMAISVHSLAKSLRVPRSRLNEIVLGKRSVGIDTALRLARYFGTSPNLWLNLQTQYDLDAARRALRPRIEREVLPHAA